MPVLSAILQDVKAEGSVYFCDTLSAPWEMDFTDRKTGSFHCLRRGSCRLTMAGTEYQLDAGDIILILKGDDHQLSSMSASEESLLMCGYFQFDHELRHPLIESFPPLLIMRHSEIANSSWLNNQLDFLVQETQHQRPGMNLVLSRQTEALLVLFLRQALEAADQSNPFIQALYDPHTSQALKLIHEAPEKNWTLDRLAREVGLSRAALANRFRRYIHQPMFSYLTDLRMARACHLLQNTTLPINSIAPQVGYESDVSFIRAFQKRKKLSPYKYRQKYIQNPIPPTS